MYACRKPIEDLITEDLSLKGMKLLAEIQHDKYCSVIFYKPDLPIEYTHTANNKGKIEIITIFLCSILISSVYKPPESSFSYTWLPPACNRDNKLITGDFNSHNTIWGYNKTNEDGALVEQLAETHSLQLIHSAKLSKSFLSVCRI